MNSSKIMLEKITYRLIVGIALIVLMYNISINQASAQTERFVLEAGSLYHELPLDQSYGEYLKERFGISHLVLEGSALSVQYLPDVKKNLSVGFEISTLSGEFSFIGLNGNSGSNSFELTQNIFTLKYILFDHLLVGAGVGENIMTRNVHGYQDNDIVTTNVSSNQGSAQSQTRGEMFMAEASFKLLNNFDPSQPFDFGIGARYINSNHTISASDERPALDEAGFPVGSTFNVGGIQYFANVSIAFGSN